MNNVSNLILSEQIMNLRMAAASLYDTGLREGMKPEEIKKEIEPVHQTLHKLIKSAAAEDLAGVVIASKRLEHQIKCHAKDIDFLRQKQADAQYYIHLLHIAVGERMKADGVDKLQDGGFMATYDQKVDAVTFR